MKITPTKDFPLLWSLKAFTHNLKIQQLCTYGRNTSFKINLMTLLSFNSFYSSVNSCISNCDDLTTISTTCVFIRENLLLFATLNRLNFIIFLHSRGVGVCKCSGLYKIRILRQSQWSLFIMGLSNSCLSISYISLLEVSWTMWLLIV